MKGYGGPKDLKGTIPINQILTIAKIKDSIAEVICHCKQHMQYELLQSMMRTIIFNKKPLRQSFIQETLKAVDNARIRIALENYINQNEIQNKKTDGR